MPVPEAEIYKQHLDVQNKYTYLLLAVAASCIALSLKRTMNSEITYSMIPLALAVLCWGISFFCGYHYLRCVDIFLTANLWILIAAKAQDQRTTDIPDIRKEMKNYSKKSTSFNKWQFRLLIYGALFFISWHIIGMIKLTIRSGG